MIKKCKDNNYVLIEYSDLLRGLKESINEDNEELGEAFRNVFVDFEVSDEIEDDTIYKKVGKDSEIIQFLKDKVGITEYEEINHDILEDALMRSNYEFNHEMKNKLSTYFRKFVDNEIAGISNETIIEDIKNDVHLFEYIKKYNSFSEYVEIKKEENEQVREKIKVNR